MITQKHINNRLELDICSDSHRVVSAKDPPGQRCVYIYPGDLEREIYRLSTFSKFPNHVPIDHSDLAASGFYFTGYKDRVKCFSCGIAVEDWTITDDPKARNLHFENCEMASLSCNRNEPRNSRRLLERFVPTTSRNHTHQPIHRQTSSAGEVLMNGPTNNQPQTTTNHQPIHRQTSSAGEVLMNGPTNNQPQTATNRQIYQTATVAPPNNQQNTNTSLGQNSNNERLNLVDLFPCHNPANPHMHSAVSREQTFAGNNNWPGDRIRATPRQIAEAGMFYLGNRDRVKCWYCNGGLQNWDTSDDPWFEHAKWFPDCEFVLQSKGTEFVENVSSQFPNLRRPTRRNNQQSAAQTNNAAPEIIDPRIEIEERRRKVENEMGNSHLVEHAKRMGFSEEEIKEAFYRQFESSNAPFHALAPLIESLLSAANSQQPPVSMETATTSSTVPKQSAPTSAVEELRNLEKSRLCRTCSKDVADVVFLPCGHLATCSNCPKAQRCPVCNTRITDRFKVFMS